MLAFNDQVYCFPCIRQFTRGIFHAIKYRPTPVIKTAKIAFLISIGLFLADVSSARIWIGKNGNKIDAEFVKFDPEAKTVTIRQGDIEHKVAFDNLGEEDQTWVVGQNATPAEEPQKDGVPNGASNEILLLLNKAPEEVAVAIKTSKVVEDLKSLETTPRQRRSDGSMGFRHSYDSGKVTF